MGLAASQARLLMYTARKADCELRISKNSTEKMALAREQSKLSQEYHSKLNSKKLAYYADGAYHKLNYTYLMGMPNFDGGVNGYINNDNYVKKQKLNMILTDSNGLVVLNNAYANSFRSAGLEEGKPFPVNGDKFIAVLCDMCMSVDAAVTPADVQAFIDNHEYVKSGKVTGKTALGNENEHTNEIDKMSIIKDRIAYWYPIVLAAATNGWTTEYANQLDSKSLAYQGEDYIGDAIQSGLFNLALVQEDGSYMPDATLSFFTTTGEGIVENMSSDEKEKLTAWYNAEHDRISEKETYLDLEITDLSTELEAIKTAIQSIESYTQDAITSIFDWGSG